MDSNYVRTQFKAPEGRYELNTERTNGLVQFQSAKPVRLTIATLVDDGVTSKYVIFNVSESLHICELEATDKVGAWFARRDLEASQNPSAVISKALGSLT
jgi:hypothetical protein